MPALRGYPGLQRDRYAEEFVELGAVGKGGYGKVYKAKHKLDGSLYAIKRIPVSSAKMAKVQEHGPEELENILREVRSLARFDHANVIRYHNAWLEFTTTPTTGAVPKTTMLRTDRLLEDAAALGLSPEDTEDIQARLKEMSFADMFEKSNEDHSANIVFGTDHTETSRDEQPLVTRRHNSRRGSQATIATISSTKSRMSAVRDADGEDSDIETIPRSHVPRAQESTTEVSEDMVSHSDMSGSLVPIRHSGPILMLNVQMSLCETNLAALLSAEQPPANAQSVDRHCFHPCISLELLYHIVCGVEYLHAQGVVHRDLKPANVFLSLSTARHPPYGSMDRATCKACPERKCLHITPRIGDFGLVAALDDQCMGADTASKPVGTEFYRPGTSGKISESLDVFALGVVGFELLQKFETRMERVAALTTLRKGEFPADFEQNVGDLGAKVQRLIGDMVSADEEKRASCEEVKMEIAKLVHVLKED
jgi:translation initiation factor 2-alpha kinase 3